MIRDERGKPADALSRGLFVFGNPNGCRAHHFHFGKIAAGLFSAFFDKAKAPSDQMRVGELKNDAIPDAARAPQCFRPVARDPNRRYAFVSPTHLNGLPVIVDLLSAVEIAN